MRAYIHFITIVITLIASAARADEASDLSAAQAASRQADEAARTAVAKASDCKRMKLYMRSLRKENAFIAKMADTAIDPRERTNLPKRAKENSDGMSALKEKIAEACR